MIRLRVQQVIKVVMEADVGYGDAVVGTGRKQTAVE